MDIFEIRRTRLRQLIDDDFGGNQAAFSRYVQLKPSHVNRWLSDKAAKIPTINEVSARNIEDKCNKPEGWMDSLVATPKLSPQALKIAEIISSLPSNQQDLIIHLVESTLEMWRQAQLIGQSASTDDRQET